jgi:hypothetical protein
VVFLWGGNNAGTKWLVASWPPIWTGGIRFLLAGLLLLAVLRFTSWLGESHALTAELRRQLWLRGGLSLAVYIVAFNWALRLTAASHVALYIGASPVWTLLWEERPQRTWASARRYGAALLALAGVLVLFWPALRTAKPDLLGEFFGLTASILWANFSHQIRAGGDCRARHPDQRGVSGRAGVLRPVWRRDPLRALEQRAPPLAHEPGGAVQQSHSVEHDGLGVLRVARTGHGHVLVGHGIDCPRGVAGPGQLGETFRDARRFLSSGSNDGIFG